MVNHCSQYVLYHLVKVAEEAVGHSDNNPTTLYTVVYRAWTSSLCVVPLKSHSEPPWDGGIVMDFSFFFFVFFVLFVCLFVLGQHLWHMEVPRLGVELQLQLPAYTTATAAQDPSHICDLHHSSGQHQILNPLRDGIQPQPHGS